MKTFFVLLMLFAAWALPAHAEEEACDMLFVQDAKTMVFDGTQLTLKEANPNIIFFCDRPVRTAGHLTLDAFMKLVTEGENNFKENPPNAAISVFDGTKGVIEAVVGLPERPVLKGKDLVFAVKVIEGELPAEGGPVVMFIDPIGRPLSPGSIAGVHRRHRRRAIMRH